jgi:hypothetical protein
MDSDDPQQRVAGPAAESGGRTPRPISNYTANVWNGLVTVFLAVGLGICAVTYGVLTPYAYWVGTPAKAKVEHWELHGISNPDSSPDLDCTGTWSVRGQAQSGPIKPPFRGDQQNGVRAGKAVLDVRVHDGTAYTKFSAGKGFYVGLATGVGLVV